MASLFRPLSALVLTAGVLSAPACAEAGPPPHEAAMQGQMPRLSASNTLAMCFQRFGDPAARETCIGEYSATCAALSPDGQSEAGRARCADEEYRAWQGLLDEALNTVRQTVDGDAEAALSEAQSGWRAQRDAECASIADRSEEDGAELAQSQCLLRATAQRTLQLQARAAE